MTFSEKLDKLMTERELSAYEISKATGISDRLIGYWRKGEKKPSLENITKLCEYLNVRVDWLMSDDDLSEDHWMWRHIKMDFPLLWSNMSAIDRREVLSSFIDLVMEDENGVITHDWLDLLERYTGRNHSEKVQGTNPACPDEVQEVVDAFIKLDIKGKRLVWGTIYAEQRRMEAETKGKAHA